MPAIASLEDLKAAQKEGLGYLRYALWALLFYGHATRDTDTLLIKRIER
jgi:hypothetical protein